MQQHAQQRDRHRVIVDHYAKQQQSPRLQVVMVLTVTQGHRLNKCMQTQPGNDAIRHFSVRRMRVPMLNSHRNDIQCHLHKESRQHQRANQQGSMRMTTFLGMLVIKLGKEMEHRQAQQKCARERVEQSNMLCIVEPEDKNRQRPQNDA